MKSKSGLRFFLSFIQIIIFSLISSSQPKYRISDIPKNLLDEAKAVIRKSETEFEITGINKAVKKVTFAITILNTNGIKNSVLIEFYNKFMSVRKIEWHLFDQYGQPVKNKSNIDLQDYSAISGYSVYEDNRVKFVDPKFRTTPFTVEYTYEIVYNGLISYPCWNVYKDYNISIEQSKFTIVTPKGFKFRYLEKNLSDSCVISDKSDKTYYTWVARNQPIIKEEPFAAPHEEYTPNVYTAPNDFEISGYKGNLETWNNFSTWIDKLGEGRNILSPESTEKIKGLIAGLKTDYEKIDTLYKYMQSKVRYVSIQVGLGGWQPVDAETVDRLSYGDCKALSNYMKSLLEIAGIKSSYALVLAGENSNVFKEDFPSNQFNHAMVCVPLLKDTIWLECTNQHFPAGYLGKFTDNRKVLLTGEGLGSLARTREYTIDNNFQSRQAIIDLAPDGNAESLIRTSYKGIFYDDVCNLLFMDEIDKKKFIQNRITIPSYNLLGFTLKEKRQIIPSIEEEIRLYLPNYGSLMGNKMLLNPNLLTRFEELPYRTKDRKSIIRIVRSYCETDSIVFKLPLIYKVDQIPRKSIIKSRFGEYITDISFDIKEIRYIRTFRLFKGDYPVTDLEEFIVFCEKVTNSDDRKIVLTKI